MGYTFCAELIRIAQVSIKVGKLFDLSGNFTLTTLLQLCGFIAVVIPMQELDNAGNMVKES